MTNPLPGIDKNQRPPILDMKNLYITKASGETVPFSTRKLRKSLRRGGASTPAIEQILAEVERNLYPGIPTAEIYQRALELLKDANSQWAGRYKLKRAIQELGPSGFPFERFVAELLRVQGFNVQNGLILQGRCVSHEVDVWAEKSGERILAECKFHGLPGIQSDVKIPLYVKSRFDDLAEGMAGRGENARFQRWLVTNTRFTGDAIRYGTCAGLQLVSWDYPGKGSLRDLIDQGRLYPITCLSTINSSEKDFLLKKDIVLVSDLAGREDLLRKSGVSRERLEGIVAECRKLGQ